MKNNGSEATVKMERPADASAAQRFIGLGGIFLYILIPFRNERATMPPDMQECPVDLDS